MESYNANVKFIERDEIVYEVNLYAISYYDKGEFDLEEIFNHAFFIAENNGVYIYDSEVLITINGKSYDFCR